MRQKKSAMERMNSPFVFLAFFIPFVCLAVHAYPKEQEQPYTDADKQAMQELINSLVDDTLTTDVSAYVYLYNESGEI